MARIIEKGKKYLHKNGLFVRKVREIDSETVYYSENYGGKQGACSIATFKAVCPKEATKEDEQKERDFCDKYAKRFE